MTGANPPARTPDPELVEGCIPSFLIPSFLILSLSKDEEFGRLRTACRAPLLTISLLEPNISCSCNFFLML